MNERPPSRSRLLPLLVAELKRRGVWRAASLYVVGAWVAIQGTDMLASAFEWPRELFAGVIILAIVGLPLVMIGSWLYRVGVESEDVPRDLGVSSLQLRAAMGVAILFGVALLGASGWYAMRRTPERPASAGGPELQRIAVLYFRDLTEDDEYGYLAPALTGELIDQLSAVDGLDVISREGVAPYRDGGMPLDSIARDLSAGVLVAGSVMESGGRVRVTVQLIEPVRGSVLKSVQVDTPAVDPIALVDAVVGEVADSLRVHLGRELRVRRWQSGTRNGEAWRLLQQAAQLNDRARRLRVATDAGGALAALAAADSLLDRAFRLDPHYHEARVLRATNAYARAMLLVRRQDPEAVRHVLSDGEAIATGVLQRDRRNAEAYEARGILRELRHAFAPPADTLAARDLLASAEQDLRTSIELDPRRVRARHALSAALDERGAFPEALVFLEEAYRLDAFQENATSTVDRLFTINFELGSDEEAARWCTELRRRAGPEIRTAACELQLMAWAEGGQADVARARSLAAEALALDPSVRQGGAAGHLDVLVAAVMARAGQADSARALLARARTADPDNAERLQLEAGVRVILADYDTALALLHQYARMRRPALLANSRRFAPLPGNPLRPAAVRP